MDKISKKTEQASQGEGKLIKVEVADPAHGHQTLMLKPEAAQEYLSTQGDKWIFVDNEFTQSENLSLVNWNTTETVRVLPGLVGGMNANDKSNKMKLLVVGLGGIGSQLTELIVPALQISGLNVELNLMDNDVVDESNLAHQRFCREDKNSPKVEALQQRYQRYEHVKTIAHNNNLTTSSQLKGYDIIVVAVDRQEPRNLVHSSDADWVDLRCQGDGWMLIDSDTNTSILNKIPNNKQPVGCQLPGAIESGNIEFGFAAVAALGAQWVIQKLRTINGVQSKTPKFSMGYLTHGQMKTSALEEI